MIEIIKKLSEKKLKEAGMRNVTKEDLIPGFEYLTRGISTDWTKFTYPDKPSNVDCPLELAWIVTKIK